MRHWLAKSGKRVGAADVYETVVSEWMDRDVGKHLFLPTLKVEFMEELARRLWAQARQEIHFEELRKWLQEQMKEKMPAVTMEDAARADTDLRTATFLMRDPKGNYRFAHRSFMEFFLARHIARQLSSRDATVLTLPRLSKEVLEFAVDLVHYPSFNLNSTQQTITNILESVYTFQVSENALLLKTCWDRLRSGSSPAPAAFHLEGADLSGVDLSAVRLNSVYLNHANLEEANLAQAALSGDLSEVNLTRAKASQVNLTGNSLRRAKLDAADLSGTNLAQCDFSEAKGAGIFFCRSDLSSALLNNAAFAYARLARANISQPQIAQADFFRASMPDVSVNQLTPVLQTGHSSDVRSVHFSPDGKLLTSGSSDNTVKLWDVASGKLIYTLISCWGDGRWVVYTPDGIFDASEAAMDLIWFADGLVVYPSSEFAQEFHRPEEIQARLRQAMSS
ncbi:MAG: pentapeptide repeat-containing protein [bacterium]|nr:pentapeptide repeat-containing protein [bacterium]